MRAKLLKWGNGLGFYVAKKDVERLRLREGQEVEFPDPKPMPAPFDWSKLPLIEDDIILREHHDEIDWA